MALFSKVLVANRGEIACRVIRALRELGIGAVAVYSDADATALHVRMADEAVRIGPGPAAESYLRAEAVLEAAARTGADAIHPGYGFLSENAGFAEACAAGGRVFVGPPARAMRLMGSKTDARRTMVASGVPVVPGTAEAVSDAAEALAFAEEAGFPVLLKAAAGGGGKGMRLCHLPEDLGDALDAARREALSAFGDDRVYVEKAIVRPRHIEIQVLADTGGNAVHLFERECSVQRRHQKVIEESPAANLPAEVRDAMGAVAVRGTRAIGYVGAGTFEFLLDTERRFYFLEMNTRLQVEHAVTEMVVGVDLVALQIRIASGEPLPFAQEDLRQRGHAIECRIYAEDPARGFAPAPGTLHRYEMPAGPGIRVDDGFREGDRVPVFYDPMIAKLCAFAPTRAAAIARAERALGDVRLAGIGHNADFLRWVLGARAFVEGRYTTRLLEDLGPWRPEDPAPELRDLLLVAACLAEDATPSGPRAPGGDTPQNGEPPDLSAWRQAFRSGKGGS